MITQRLINFFFKQKLSNYFLFFLVFFFSIIFSKYGFWYDVNSFYTNLLRNFEGQTFFKDYFCHFFPIQFIFLSPFLNYLSLDTFMILFSIILNFLFAFQFTYYSKKILNNKLSFFNFFIILSFFFIPFGIGTAHHNELTIYFCTIGFLMAVNSINKLNIFALAYLIIGLTVKNSIAIPIFAAIFFSFTILLISNFNKQYLVLFLKYIFLIALSFLLIIFIYALNANIGFKSIFEYLFVDPFMLSQSRITLKSFLFFNQFNEVLGFFFDYSGIKSLPVGSILQLPIIFGYICFIYLVISKRKKFSEKEKIYFYFLIFAAIFLFVSLGRDWNHKIIFFIIINYLLFFYFFGLEKKITTSKMHILFSLIISVYLLIPINERIPLKNLNKNSKFEFKNHFFKFSDNGPYIALKRSIFEHTNGVLNLNKQYTEISNYLIQQNNLSLFYIDDISTIFSSILSKAPRGAGCMHTWFLTPPLNKEINKEWMKIFLENYYNLENAKLIICKTDDKLCLFSPIYSNDGKLIAVAPTELNDSPFIKELISNSKISFNTENFYIYEKK
jgi:hypothetical protein